MSARPPAEVLEELRACLAGELNPLSEQIRLLAEDAILFETINAGIGTLASPMPPSESSQAISDINRWLIDSILVRIRRVLGPDGARVTGTRGEHALRSALRLLEQLDHLTASDRWSHAYPGSGNPFDMTVETSRRRQDFSDAKEFARFVQNDPRSHARTVGLDYSIRCGCLAAKLENRLANASESVRDLVNRRIAHNESASSYCGRPLDLVDWPTARACIQEICRSFSWLYCVVLSFAPLSLGLTAGAAATRTMDLLSPLKPEQARVLSKAESSLAEASSWLAHPNDERGKQDGKNTAHIGTRS